MEKGMKWKVGDRAIVDCPPSRQHGNKCTIVALNVGANGVDGIYVGHEVDLFCCKKNGGKSCVFEPQELKPIPDTYDGNEVTSWEECPWQPSVLA